MGILLTLGVVKTLRLEMWGSVHIYVYVYMQICTHICLYTDIHLYTHTYVCIDMYIWMHTHTHVCVYCNGPTCHWTDCIFIKSSHASKSQNVLVCHGHRNLNLWKCFSFLWGWLRKGSPFGFLSEMWCWRSISFFYSLTLRKSILALFIVFYWLICQLLLPISNYLEAHNSSK